MATVPSSTRARVGDHVYSDKAPGASLVAVPAHVLFLAVRALARAPEPGFTVRDPVGEPLPDGAVDAAYLPPGHTVEYNASFRADLYLCSLAASALPTVAAGWAIAACLAAAGFARRIARLCAVLYVAAGPALAYGASFYGHQLAAGTLACGFALAGCGPPPSPRRALAAGLLLGLAVAAEYPVAPVAAGLWLHTALRGGARPAAAMAAGGAVWAAVLAAYHTAAFGSPLSTGYDAVELPVFAEGMARGYGIGWPRPEVALALLFGSYRGLFVAAPVAILAAFGLAVAARRGRRGARAAAAIFVYFWLLDAGYYMWDGGSAAIGRHMLPGLPFLWLGLGPVLERYRTATLVLAAVSVLHAVAFATAGPEAPRYGSAVWDHALPRLWSARGHPGAPAGNLGLVLGLPGPASLVPLATAWFVALAGPRRGAARAQGALRTAR